MNQKHAGVHKLPSVVLLWSGILLTVYFLFWHVRLGLIRYFDIDEFAHLRWTAQMLMGKKPYVDFLLFIPPGLYWFLAPAFAFGWGTVQPVITARILMSIIFALLCIVIGLIFWEERRSKVWIVAPLILAFLPLPFDKFLEIRPDNLAVLLFFVGLLCQLKLFHTYTRMYAYLAGFWYALSLVVLTKMIPPVLFALLVFGASALRDGKLWRLWKPFAIGFIVPLAVVFLWALTLGDMQTVIYSLTKLPLEANNISQSFIMMPDLFFYPNFFYYGKEEYWFGLYTNHAVWIFGLGIGLFRLFTPFLTQTKERARDEILFAGIFFLNVILYVQFVPLKHAQYLIPVAVGIAFYAADGALLLWRTLQKTTAGRFTMAILALGIAGTLFSSFQQTVKSKSTLTNTKDLGTMNAIFTTIPFSAEVLDLVGLTLYYPSPYPVCCLPFGQFARYLSRPLSPLAQTLERMKTPYIYEGAVRRMQTLSYDDQLYVQNHYVPSAIDYLWVRK